MTGNPALQQLKDIHLPRAIHLWPVAPGWIILYMIAAVVLGYWIYFWYQSRRRGNTIKYALRQLHLMQALMQHNPDNINLAAELSTLIRRTALYYFERDAIAGLSGEGWLQFLNTSGCTTEFTTPAGQLLIDAPYRKNNHADLAPLFELTQNWLTAISKTNRKEK
jgi:hypothetical protein